MFEEINGNYMSAAEVERHLLEARRMRSAAMRDMFSALGRALTPRAAATKEEKTAPVAHKPKTGLAAA